MASIDERIVEMSFKGAAFLSGVSSAISALSKLKNSLNGMKGAESDINNLDAAGKRFSLAGMANGIDGIKSKFSAMGVVGVTALATVANRAVSAGISMVKALTIDPIKAGLDVYQTKINAIQTILANTASEGTNLSQVTAALNQLNTYANKTVYNFGQMAQNIGTFTAAGVNLKDSVSSIKGIANLAALSGSSAEQASTAMYQLSQSIAAGKVNLQDWNSVVNAGLGGKVFQNQLIETARATGVNIDAIIKKAGSFRNSLQQGWLTSNILTKTLATFTGDLSTAQLKAMGFTNQEAIAIQKQAQNAVNSATQIRTVSQLFSALKEEVATAWSHVFEAIIGNIGQATSTLTSLHNVAETALTSPINKLAALLAQFRKLGGFDLIIQGVGEAFHALGMVLSTIGAAFRSVFPSNGGSAAQGLIKIAIAFQNFAEKLTPSKKTLSEIKTIFEGLFSVVKIVIDVIGGLISGITKVGGAAGGAGGGFLALIATIAKFIIGIKNAIESGNVLTKFFQVLGTIISLPVKALGAIIGALTGVGGAATKAVGGLSGFVGKVGAIFSKLSDAIINGIKSGNLSKVGTIINQLLLGGVLLQIRKFIKGLGSGGGGGGLFSTIKESFEGLTNALKAMQTNLKSGTLVKIAIAVALLTASLVALSFVNIGSLTKALAAMTVMFTELLGALTVVAKIAGSAGVVKMTVIGFALNELATAILVLTGAVAILARLSWEQLAKGLSAIAILLAELLVAIKLMSANTAGLIASAAGMTLMAVALDLMANAVKKLGSLNFGELVKGMGSVAALLLLLTAFQKLSSGSNLIGTAAGMVLIGVALNVVASAIAKLGSLSFQSLFKGLVTIAGALAILVLAMNAMKGSLGGAAAMIVASAALLILSDALKNMGSESWGQIGQSLVLLAGSLLIIAAAMIAMVGALPGAAALLIVSGALAILAPILILLGSQSWTTIVTGLLALSGAFVIIGAAGILLGPLVPVLIALGAAIVLMGVGMLAAGAGIGVFAAGLTALAIAVTASGAAIVAFVTSILTLIPVALAAIGQGIAAFATAIATAGVAIINAFASILNATLNAIIKFVPTAVTAFGRVITGFLTAITTNSVKIISAMANLIVNVLNTIARSLVRFVTAGANMIISMLNGMARNIPRIVTAGANMIISFINAIGSNTQRVVNAGINMVIRLINGIANEIRARTPALSGAMRNLGSAIMGGLISAIFGGFSGVISAITNVVGSAINWAKNLLGIHSPSKVFMEIGDQVMQGWALGHLRSAGVVTDSLTTVGQAAISSLKNTMSTIGSTLNDNLDLQPTITPVVDLTQAKAGFSQLSSLSKDQLINAGASSSSAASISASSAAAAAQAGLLAAGTNITFNQTNTSPVALSAATIYRQTKNQLSIARGALTGANAG